MERVRLAVVTEDARRAEAARRFCTRLNASTGVFFEPLIVATYSALQEGLRKGEAQLAWSPPLAAYELHEEGVVQVLVAVKRGIRASYHSALFVAAASELRTLDDLVGARAAWVSPVSASGYLVPRWQLKAKGYDVHALFRTETFCGTHEKVGLAVLGGEADVGATHVTVDPVGQQLVRAPWPHDARGALGIRVLQLVGPLPGDVILARRDLSARLQQRLTAAFLSLRAGERTAQDLFDATQFELVSGSHFVLLERLSAIGSPR